MVEISNPWKPGKLLHRYYLVPRENPQPSDLSDGTIVRTPIERAAVFTTVHCALLTELELGSHIVAVADAEYIKVPYIQEHAEAQARAFVLSFDGEETGIETISIPSNPSNSSTPYFTLDGRRLNKPSSSGLYIHNGRKVLIK